MPIFGILTLFCPICGLPIKYDANKPGSTYHHKEFGIVCNKHCFDLAKHKYAQMILGHNDA